jgi:DME family drug/metabolite transporter
LDDLTTTGFAFTLGGILLAVIAAPLSFQPAFGSVGLLLLLGTLPTAVAYTLYFRGLRSASPATASLIALLEPLTGALLAALVLGDRLGTSGLAGAALLTMAVSLAAVTANRLQ